MRRLRAPAAVAGAVCSAGALVAGVLVVLDLPGGDAGPGPLRARPETVQAGLAVASSLSARIEALPPPRQRTARSVTLEPRPEPKPKPEPEPEPEPQGSSTAQPAAPEPAAEARFTISSFNVLGSSHTRGKGGMAPGTVRIRQAANLLNAHSVDIAGLQEMQGDQFRAFQSATGGTFGVYPGMAAGPLGVENSIVWRRSVWTLESGNTVQIPYFDGRMRPMPYILLKHNATGRRVWAANFHNPASNPKRGNQDRHRARAAAIETSLAARLWRESGYPVFVTGDMNDREAYFCRMTAGAPMQAANGGSNTGACRPPPYPMPVDWIFGSLSVTFSGWVKDESQAVRRTSDHPMIRADVLLDGLDGIATAD